MRAIFLTLVAIGFFLSAKAQHADTTVYEGCKAANDTSQTIDEPSILDSCPHFKNGLQDLYKFIAAHKHYPLNARKNHIEGKVIISMIIEKDGSISHIVVVRHISDDLDKEALRVIKLLPKWKPGILHKNPVRVKFYIVVGFSLS